MAGKLGQRSTKGTEIPQRYTEDYLSALDRRCREARGQRDLFSALVSECGGLKELELTELETLRRFAHLCRRMGKAEELELTGGKIDEAALNDSTRSWLGLLREFQRIKAKHHASAGDPLDEFFAAEGQEEA